MRRGLSTISVFSILVSFCAAVVLCLQTPSLPIHPGWPETALTQWGAELVLFGLALLVGRPNLSLRGWLMGMGTLVAVRVLISATAGYVLAGYQSGPAWAAAVTRLDESAPRLAATVFSLMVTYPLRALIPGRASRTLETEPDSGRAGETSLWVMQGDQSLRVNEREEKTTPSAPMVMTIASPEQYRGSLELPLRVLLAGVPSRWLAPGSGRYTDTEAASVPLSLIVPQLKDARVMLTLDDLRQILPPDLVNFSDRGDSEGEPTVVLLPLEEVISQLPPAALELPPSSPPAWAELPDPESVVFATV